MGVEDKIFIFGNGGVGKNQGYAIFYTGPAHGYERITAESDSGTGTISVKNGGGREIKGFPEMTSLRKVNEYMHQIARNVAERFKLAYNGTIVERRKKDAKLITVEKFVELNIGSPRNFSDGFIGDPSDAVF